MLWKGRRQSTNIEDRRGQGGGFGGGLGGGLGGGFGRGSGPRIGFPGATRRGGGIGIGTIIVIVIAMWLFGINPMAFLDSGSTPVGGGGQQTGQVGAPADEDGQFVATVLADTEDTWTQIFTENGRTYREPTLVLFTGRVTSACGMATAASGPFYCPGDSKVYIDLAFFAELSRRFGAPGDFAAAYVIAHEVGHHVQNELGILPKVDQARRSAGQAEANQLSVRLELQADCLAGIWARKADDKGIVEVGDIDEALNAATQIGDDTLQRQSQGYVVPDSFTHGSSAQRSRWFKQGYNQGTLNACDTFGPSQV